MKKASLCFLEMSIIFLMLFVFLISSNTSFAAMYYVKDNNCSDSNSGSESFPWCHCPGMTGWTGTATLSAGDTVYFESSGVWAISSGTYLLSITGGVTYVGDSWGTGTRAKFELTGDITEYIIRFYDDDSTHETIFQGFELDGNGNNSGGIGMGHPGWSSNFPLTGATKRIENCVIHDTYSEAPALYRYGIIISNWGGASAQITNVEILNNVIFNQSRTCINLYPSNSACGEYSIRNITIRGNECYDTAQDPGYNAGVGVVIKNCVHDAVVEYNYIHGDHGIWGEAILINSDVDNCEGPDNITIRYNILTANRGDGIYISRYGNHDVDIYGNLIFNCSTTQGIVFRDGSEALSDSIDYNIYNNTLYNNNIVIGNFSATVRNLEVKNNIIHVENITPLIDRGRKIESNGHNNNTYYRTSTGTILVTSGSNNYTASTLSSYESTALSSDPLFVNTSNLPTGFTGTYGSDKQPNTDGLSLQSDSPAQDVGVDLGSPYNSSINSINRPYGRSWDRGAYENMIGPSPPLNLRIIE